MERPKEAIEKHHGPSPEDRRYDGESTAGFMEGMIDDLTKQRLKEVELFRKSGEISEEKAGEMLREIQADAVMIAEQEQKALAHSATMESHAMIDVLTELPNRRSFDDKLKSEIGRLNRLEGHEAHEAHVLLIDIDHFKQVNDTLGHDIGDLYLKTAAAYMKQVVRRGTDVLARVGGDEFAAILFENDDASAKKIAEEITAAVREASIAAKEEATKRGLMLSTDDGNISASIGLASFRKGEPPAILLKRADTAMYAAKESGRNQVAVAQ